MGESQDGKGCSKVSDYGRKDDKASKQRIGLTLTRFVH